MKTKFLKKISVLSAILLTACIILVGAPHIKADSSSDSTVQGLEDQLRYLEQKQKEIQQRLSENSSDLYNQQIYSQQLETLIATVQDKIRIADELIAALEESKKQLEDEIVTAEEDFNRTYDEFLGFMRMSYEDGDASYISLILGANSLSDFLSRVDRVSSMLAHSKKLMAEYKSAKQTLENKKAECELAIEKQNETVKSLEETRSENVALLNNANLYIKQLEQNQSDYNAQLNEYQKAWSEANEKLTQYLAYLAELSKSQYNQEGFAWPMDKNQFNYMTSGYGWRFIFGRNDFHLGIDIWGYGCYGAEIHASASGKIVVADHNGYTSYGKYVVIDHGSGIMTLYAHCSNLAVNVGDAVHQGDVIAYCGDTGMVTGAHLHFEYRINGQTYNPLEYINVPSNFVDISG